MIEPFENVSLFRRMANVSAKTNNYLKRLSVAIINLINDKTDEMVAPVGKPKNAKTCKMTEFH